MLKKMAAVVAVTGVALIASPVAHADDTLSQPEFVGWLQNEQRQFNNATAKTPMAVDYHLTYDPAIPMASNGNRVVVGVVNPNGSLSIRTGNPADPVSTVCSTKKCYGKFDKRARTPGHDGKWRVYAKRVPNPSVFPHVDASKWPVGGTYTVNGNTAHFAYSTPNYDVTGTISFDGKSYSYTATGKSPRGNPAYTETKSIAPTSPVKVTTPKRLGKGRLNPAASSPVTTQQ